MQNDLFTDCGVDVLAFPLRRYAGGARIFTHGDPADSAYLIVSGVVFLARRFDARMIERMTGGRAIGLEVAFGDRFHNESATCAGAALIAAIPAPHLRVLIAFEPRIALNIARIMSGRLDLARAALVSWMR